VGIGDYQLHAGEAAPLEPAQELDPEGFGLRGANRHAQHLTPTVGIDRDGHGHGDRDDPAGLAHLHVSRVDPQIWPITFDRALEEGPHPLVDFRAQAAHLALGDAGHAQRPDQLVDRARRDALHVGFLDHCRECPLRHSPWLQEAWKVAALPELGDAQLDRPGAGLPDPVAIAVALCQPVRRALAVRRAGQALHLERHQALGSKADHLAQEIGVGALLQQLAKGDPVVGHRGGLRSGVAARNPTLPELPR
jgi:hypothetical protein